MLEAFGEGCDPWQGFARRLAHSHLSASSPSATGSIQALDQCLDLGFAPCDRSLAQAHRSRVHAELYPVVPGGPAHGVAPEHFWQPQQGAKGGQAGLVHDDFLFLQVDGIWHRICFRRR